MSRTSWLWAPAVCLAVVGCGGNNATSGYTGTNPYSPDTRSDREREEAVSRATQALAEKPAKEATSGMNMLAFGLLKKSVGEKGNVALSPASVALAVGMAYTGAAGDTQKEMGTMLGVEKISSQQYVDAIRNLREVLRSADPKVQLAIANSIWMREGVEFVPEFLQTNASAFGAKLANLDFSKEESVKTINDWVSENTNKKIPSIIDKLRPEEVMLLVNAVYFKGLWRDPFDKKITQPKPFTVSAEKKVEVPTMYRMGSYPYAKVGEAAFVAVPFGAGRFQFVGVLPPAGEDIAKFVEGMDAKKWQAATETMPSMMVELSLPRFKVEWGETINETLQTLGMKQAFTDAADFSGMRAEKDVMITEVRHRALVEVDEEGAEAAAATSVGVGVTSMPQTVEVKFDRPFLFAIRDSQTGLILFVGVVRDPS